MAGIATGAVSVTIAGTASGVSLSLQQELLTIPENPAPVFMAPNEANQDPFWLKVTPAKAGFRSGTTVGRCRGACGDRQGEKRIFPQH